MTVVHDTHTQSSTWINSPNPFTFNHTPTGTINGVPDGVVVLITANEDGGANVVTGVSYGGVEMSLVADGFAGEIDEDAGSAYIYFLGNGIPSGTQSVSIGCALSSGTKVAWCCDVVANIKTMEYASVALDGNTVNPQITLDSKNHHTLRYFVINSGLPNTSDLALVSGMVAVGSVDHGDRVSRCDRESSAHTGSVVVGYTASSDDVAMVGVAIRELPYPYNANQLSAFKASGEPIIRLHGAG